MGKAARKKAERRNLRKAFGTDCLPKNERRQLDPTIEASELWPHVPAMYHGANQSLARG